MKFKKKMWPMSVGKLYGIGSKTGAKLNQLGIKSIGDLATASLKMLEDNFGERHAKSMRQSANGHSNSALDPESKSKLQSVGNELTYSQDIKDDDEVKQELLLLADTVGYRLRKKC